MATPRGAEHHDLEQQLRDLRAQVRQLTGAALRRPNLGVTEGDFVVQGGGDVLVLDGGRLALIGDGGTIQQVANDGRLIYQLGDLTTLLGEGTTEEGAHLMFTADGDTAANRFEVAVILPGGAYPTGLATLKFVGDAVTLFSPVDVYDTLEASDLSSTGNITAPNLPTTSDAANVNWNAANGNLRVVTSSARYKADVQDAEVDPDAVLQLRPRTWRDRAEVEADPGTESRHVGFIAEEVHDTGLTDLVTYDDEGRPDALRYDRFTVALLELARRQQEQIADLQERVTRLEGSTG